MEMLCGVGPGTLVRNMRVPDSTQPGINHPHTVDVFVPPGALLDVFVLLHGAGGTKERFARSAGVLKSATVASRYVDWDFLATLQVAAVFPMGQRCTGNQGPFNPYGINTVTDKQPDGVRTWSNRVMWSGANDLQFLRDLVTVLTGMFPNIRTTLAGHSNGGMMAQRTWYEEPTLFDCFASIAGPAAIDYDPVYGTLPLPTIKRPFYEQIGEQDNNINTIAAPDGVFSDRYFANPANFGRAFVAYNPALPAAATPVMYSSSWAQFCRRVVGEGGSLPDRYVTQSMLTVKIGTGPVWSRIDNRLLPDAETFQKYRLCVLSAAGHAYLSNRRKPENAPGHSQCAGRRLLKLISTWVRSQPRAVNAHPPL